MEYIDRKLVRDEARALFEAGTDLKDAVKVCNGIFTKHGPTDYIEIEAIVSSIYIDNYSMNLTYKDLYNEVF